MLRAAGWTAGMVVTLGVVLTGYYCWRVTGSPARLPYQVNRDTYGWPENLAFLPPKVLKLRHKALDDMYRKELDNRTRYTGATNIAANLGTRWFDSWTFLIGPALTVPLLLVPWMLRRPRTYPLAIFIGLIFVLNLFQMVLYPYHLGPVVPAAFALMAQGSRRIYLTVARKWRGRGMAFALALPAVLLLVGAMKQEAAVLRMPLAYWEIAAEGHRDARANIEDWLTARRRKQLVIVRYAPGHSPDQEWVYNHADIDSSKVVWAREMDPEEDEKLLRYFSDREVWLLRADEYPQRVVHYRLEPAGGFLPTCGGSQPSLLPAPQVTEPPHP
jgi:hypothetical protein